MPQLLQRASELHSLVVGFIFTWRAQVTITGFASYVHINSKITAMVKIVYDHSIFYMGVSMEKI